MPLFSRPSRFASSSRLLMMLGLILATFVGASINPPSALSQIQIAQADSESVSSQEADAAAAKAPFSQLVVKPQALAFKLIKFPGSKTFEQGSFTISDKGSVALMVTVNAPTGAGAADFSVSPTGLFTVTSSTPKTIVVTYRPVMDGKSKATVSVTSNATRARPATNVQLSGVAKGPIPTPTPTIAPTPTVAPTPTPVGTATATMVGTATATMVGTATPTMVGTATATMIGTATATMVGTATATATGTAQGTPTATATPAAQASGTTDKTSANAPGVIISGNTTVVAYVPFGSDNATGQTHGTAQVVVEPSSTTAGAFIATDRVNSCTPAKTGTVVCSGQGGDIDLITGAGAVTLIPAASITNEYAGGDCQGCGAEVDDTLGTQGLGIISTGNGFTTIDLSKANPAPSAFFGFPFQQAGAPSGNEPVGVNFGYDLAHHLILNANYEVTNTTTFTSTPPDFQIFDITNPSSPIAYDLSNAATFFASSAPCGSGTPSTMLPETSAIDEVSQIAYVTFHTPSACFSAPANDIALFDMKQATFTASSNSWSTAGEAIQSLTGIGLNGIDPISIQSTNHVAIVAGGSSGFGALSLPATSGTGTPVIPDWVGANMPNDPNGNAWVGWPQPDGLATYISPSTNKPMGLWMNVGSGTGPTFLAIVDLQALLAQPRASTNSHAVNGPNDGPALVTSGVVRFVRVQ